MLTYNTDGSVVEAISKEYGTDTLTVRRVTDGTVLTVKVSDLTSDKGELAKCREIRPVRTPH
jgi:hypothetical protein